MWLLQLNRMTSRAETMDIVGLAETQEELKSWVESLRVSPYKDGQWAKAFQAGSRLEWYNPPEELSWEQKPFIYYPEEEEAVAIARYKYRNEATRLQQYKIPNTAVSLQTHEHQPWVKPIIYRDKPSLLVCDGNCAKAWGINARPKLVLDPNDQEDFVYLSDDELGEAPIDPGTEEGGYCKPEAKGPFDMNQWCARQCERSKIFSYKENWNSLPSCSARVYNQPWKHE